MKKKGRGRESRMIVEGSGGEEGEERRIQKIGSGREL